MKYTIIRGIVVSASCIASTAALTGCATIPQPTETRQECTVKSDGMLECTTTVIWRKSSGQFNNLQMLMHENIALDFNNSQRPLLQTSLGSANPSVVTLKNNGSTVGAEASTYMKSGQRVIAENPSDLSSRLAQYNNQVDEVHLVVEKLSFQLEPGPNTVTAEVTHDTNILSGASASHYYDEGCGGNDNGGQWQESDTFC